MTDGPTTAERIRRARTELAPAEQRVAETLLDDYPMAGLGSVAQLAGRAGVSAPTVLRLLTKLGFTGYPQFREQLRGEVAQRLFSADGVYPGPAEHPLARAEQAYAETVRATFRDLDAAEMDRAVAALAERPRVLVTGGRFSATLAAHLAWFLQTLRPGVEEVPPEPGHRARALLSVDADTLLAVYDFRPSQPDTVEFARQAAERGAGLLLLLSDQRVSPADIVLTAAIDGPPPFDSMVGGLMITETLVGAVAARLGEPARARLRAFETLAQGNAE
ncbi:MurR/RpiR family transcriptional regulator [Pseudonocardia pini]|uniref:MurR/RpiR family transcriptional regulator n=1 Tax=Pseudonocardia pini TaxID=2758030 RepID=UPI001C6896A4|nr:MurR/RpiR family transcriptional regulator [Pseudonocardia pini]